MGLWGTLGGIAGGVGGFALGGPAGAALGFKAGSALGGGADNAKSSKKAARQQSQAVDKGLAIRRQMYQDAIGRMQPWSQAGQGGLQSLQGLARQQMTPGRQFASPSVLGGVPSMGQGGPNPYTMQGMSGMQRPGMPGGGMVGYGSGQGMAGMRMPGPGGMPPPAQPTMQQMMMQKQGMMGPGGPGGPGGWRGMR